MRSEAGGSRQLKDDAPKAEVLRQRRLGKEARKAERSSQFTWTVSPGWREGGPESVHAA